MRILITGANGFVGSHVVEAFGSEHHVVAVVRSNATLPGAAETRVVESIDAQTDWSGVLGDIDTVIHLAARVHIMKESAPDPLEAFREVNVRGTSRLVEACIDQGVKRFIFMSTIKVNGESTERAPFTAQDEPDPRDFYGKSKWEAEEAIRAIAAGSGLEVVVLRPTVIYGPGVKGNIERLIRMVRYGLPLPLGAVRNHRTMLSLRNLSAWLNRAVTDTTVPEVAVLLGDPQPLSTRDLVLALGQGMGRRVLLPHVPIRLMQWGAIRLGQATIAQRLLADLEVTPTFESYPGIENELEPSEVALRRLGRASARRALPRKESKCAS